MPVYIWHRLHHPFFSSPPIVIFSTSTSCVPNLCWNARSTSSTTLGLFSLYFLCNGSFWSVITARACSNVTVKPPLFCAEPRFAFCDALMKKLGNIFEIIQAQIFRNAPNHPAPSQAGRFHRRLAEAQTLKT